MNMRLNAIGKGILVALAAAVPLALITAADAATGIPEGKENTIVIVQNVGDAPADISLDIYTPAGILVPAASRVSMDVAPGGTTQFPQAVNDGLVAGFRGVGVISADQPVNALEVRDILRPTATEAKSYSLANATATGGHQLAMPILFNELLTADWNSRISLGERGKHDGLREHDLLPDRWQQRDGGGQRSGLPQRDGLHAECRCPDNV